MTIRRPSKEDLVDISDRYHLNLTEAELEVFFDLAAAVIEACNANGNDVSLLTEWMNVWVPRHYIFGDDRLWEDDRLIELFGVPCSELLADPMIFVQFIANPSS